MSHALLLASMADLFTVDNMIALLTLAGLEIVLGIDNIVFMAILADRLPVEQRAKARFIGLMLAGGIRVLLLLGIGWLMKLTAPLFSIYGHGMSGKDLILLGGGLFLIAKATHEVHNKLEGADGHGGAPRAVSSFAAVIMQILVIDVVFSLDSVITAVGMAQHVPIMVAAILISIAVMMVAAGPICRFVEVHPTLKMLALSFLVLIGVLLVAESFHQKIDKGYIYFAMAFSLVVELLNMRLRRRTQPVMLHEPHMPSDK